MFASTSPHDHKKRINSGKSGFGEAAKLKDLIDSLSSLDYDEFDEDISLEHLKSAEI